MGGLNTEIKHKGMVLLVQTQDKGLKAQYVESLVYSYGKILVSRKIFYTSFLNSPDLESTIREIIRNQHQKILDDISQGKFDHILNPKPAPNSA